MIGSLDALFATHHTALLCASAASFYVVDAISLLSALCSVLLPLTFPFLHLAKFYCTSHFHPFSIAASKKVSTSKMSTQTPGELYIFQYFAFSLAHLFCHRFFIWLKFLIYLLNHIALLYYLIGCYTILTSYSKELLLNILLFGENNWLNLYNCMTVSN